MVPGTTGQTLAGAGFPVTVMSAAGTARRWSDSSALAAAASGSGRALETSVGSRLLLMSGFIPGTVAAAGVAAMAGSTTSISSAIRTSRMCTAMRVLPMASLRYRAQIFSVVISGTAWVLAARSCRGRRWFAARCQSRRAAAIFALRTGTRQLPDHASAQETSVSLAGLLAQQRAQGHSGSRSLSNSPPYDLRSRDMVLSAVPAPPRDGSASATRRRLRSSRGITTLTVRQSEAVPRRAGVSAVSHGLWR
jgi:hypothetical protein